MSSRGRGWLKEIPRNIRPGNKNIDKDLINIENEINLIDLININNCIRSLSKIMGIVHHYCTTSQKLEKMLEHLHSLSLYNLEFGQKFATLCGQMAHFEIEDMLFRDEILKHLQKDFEDKSFSEEKQVNAIAFLGEIFYRMRLHDGSCINVLADPIMQNLKVLLTFNENNFFIFTRQVALFGSDLKEIYLNEMREIMLDVRKILMTRPMSQTPRCWLLISLDLDTNINLPEHILKFYLNFIDPKEITFLNDIKLKDIVIQPSPYQSNDLKSEDSSIGEKMNKSPDNSNKDLKDLRDKLNASKISPKSDSEKFTGRNLRGAANTEFRKPKHLNQNKGSNDLGPRHKHKAWMHDDRFYEDYDNK